MRSGVRRSERMAGHRPLRQGWGGLLFLALALAGIRAAGAAAAAAAPSPPRLRLGDAARPIRCALDLTVRPASDSFTGMVDLDLQLRRPTACSG